MKPFNTLIALALAGCASWETMPRSPAQGRPWVELSSPHFRVVTDLTTLEAQRIAVELEQGVYAIEHVAFDHSRAALEPTTVVVFRDEAAFHAFMPALSLGTFSRRLPGDLEAARFMVLYGELTPESRIDCLHELTHDLFERNFGPAPPWLHEGWAEYYSTVEIANGRVRVGSVLPHLTFTVEAQAFAGRGPDGSTLFAVPIDDVANPSELLTLDRRAFYKFTLEEEPTPDDRARGRALYLGSWAFVHLLHDRDNPLHARYLRFLESVRDEPVPVAWRKAFAGVSDAELNHELKRYLARGELVLYDAPLTLPAAPALKARALSDDEVLVLWGRLANGPGDRARLADRQFAEAVREAPGSAEAHYFRGLSALNQHRLPEAEQSLLLAARLAPNEPRYLLAVVILRLMQQPKTVERVQSGDAVMQAALPLARVAASPMQLRILAMIYRDLPDLSQALSFAKRAVALDPIDSSALDTEATVLNDLGRTDEALQVERAAFSFLPETQPGKEIQEHLRRYEERARKGH